MSDLNSKDGVLQFPNPKKELIEFSACTECGGDVGVRYLHSECHPDSPTWVRIEAEDGELARIIVECAECEKHIFTYEINDQT
ncbi:hypothetical protein LCGC14_2841680 [marine sediment metagenome]|uniref:Uncharacterized protein n=1 Tax=marine sediment metagenome TaxID=412755 RepID=A0A0F8YAZ7_9ZZZZ